MKAQEKAGTSPALSFSKKKISIIGSGLVGKAAGKGFISIGHDVSFVDINTFTIEELSKSGLIACDAGDSCSHDRDIYTVSVSTPTVNDHLDFRPIELAMSNLGRVIKNNSNWPIIVIRSTVPPGTIEERLVPILEKHSGKKLNKDFGIAANPEFLREENAEEDFIHPWIIVIGSDNIKVSQVLNDLYQPFKAPIINMSIKEAEMMKYVHNLYNANKISFFNEMRTITETIGVDADKIFNAVTESAEASWNKQYGIRNFGPFDGSCLPKDTIAFLTWADEKIKKKMPLLHAVIKVNEKLKDKRYLDY